MSLFAIILPTVLSFRLPLLKRAEFRILTPAYGDTVGQRDNVNISWVNTTDRTVTITLKRGPLTNLTRVDLLTSTFIRLELDRITYY